MVAPTPGSANGGPFFATDVVREAARLLLDEERLKTQKLECVGTLAGGIAHDFNNLLQGVFGYISMAKMSLDRQSSSLAMLEQAARYQTLAHPPTLALSRARREG